MYRVFARSLAYQNRLTMIRSLFETSLIVSLVLSVRTQKDLPTCCSSKSGNASTEWIEAEPSDGQNKTTLEDILKSLASNRSTIGTYIRLLNGRHIISETHIQVQHDLILEAAVPGEAIIVAAKVTANANKVTEGFLTFERSQSVCLRYLNMVGFPRPLTLRSVNHVEIINTTFRLAL